MARKSAIINTVGADLEKYKKRKIQEIKNLVVDSITEVELLANRSLTANSTAEFNLNFIKIDKTFKEGGLSGEVGVMGDNKMAAYIEFGTGLSAREILAPYPQWVQDIARQFYVNGQGTLEGKPYLYNNFLVVEAEFIRELKHIMETP